MSTTLVRSLLACAFVLGASGCFRYVPTPVGTTPIGSGVQMVVTPDGAEQIEAIVPSEGRAPTVRGTLLGLEDGNIVLSVPVTRRQTGFTGSVISQEIHVPADAVVSFQRREFDQTATILIGVAAAAAGTGIAVLLSQSLRGEIPDTPEPPNEFAPGVSIPWITFGVGR